jgi:hypothetical protein
MRETLTTTAATLAFRSVRSIPQAFQVWQNDSR